MSKTVMGKFAPRWRRLAYQALDSFSFKRTGRTEDGAFTTYVSPGCQLSVLDPRGLPIDAVHRRFIRDWVQCDSVVWDVGTNMGLFAFPAALKARAGQVYGFEPDVELAANLLRALRLARNRHLKVVVHCFALGDQNGAASFLISRYGRSMNKLDGVGGWHDYLFEVSERRSVGLLKIDTLAEYLRPPDVVKIDVEGAEMQVLNGGAATIAKFRPVMLVEGPRELWPDMMAFFTGHDYIVVDGQFDNPAPLSEPVWDTVAVPREKWERRTK
jgi:FkbM family methyltransferase